MPENKKHHYVPRFYLKRFSDDGKSIGLYNLDNELLVPCANLRNQCYKDYFYGKEVGFEKGLANIESEAAALFSVIDEAKCLPPFGKPEHTLMLIYILLQQSRTQFSADALDEMHDKMFKHTFREKLESELKKEGIEDVTLDDYIVGIQNSSQASIKYSIQAYPILLDLRYKLLINQTNVDFITSDNPVVMINPLMSFHKFGSSTGFASKGLQIFFPISPDKVIVLYDDNAYRLGKHNSFSENITNPRDIYNINTLQVCSCYENIYFNKENFGCKALHTKAKPFLRTDKANITVFPGKENENEKSEIIMNYKEDINFHPELSFVSIRKGAKRWKLSLRRKKTYKADELIRSRRLYDAYDEFRELVDKQQYHPEDFLKFINDEQSG